MKINLFLILTYFLSLILTCFTESIFNCFLILIIEYLFKFFLKFQKFLHPLKFFHAFTYITYIFTYLIYRYDFYQNISQ